MSRFFRVSSRFRLFGRVVVASRASRRVLGGFCGFRGLIVSFARPCLLPVAVHPSRRRSSSVRGDVAPRFVLSVPFIGHYPPLFFTRAWERGVTSTFPITKNSSGKPRLL